MDALEPELRLVCFHLTYSCAHSCGICYLGHGQTRPAAQEDGAKLVRIVHALAAASVAELCAVGGDPALSPYVLPVMQACKERGITASILSNTHDYGRVSMRQMAACVTSFQTTFHAPDAAVHDAFCGVRGAFDSVVARLHDAHREGIEIGAVINITPHNEDHIVRTVEGLVKDTGLPLSSVMIQRIMPFGGALEDRRYKLTPAVVQNVLDQAGEVSSRFGLQIIFEDPLPFLSQCRTDLDVPLGCAWGISKASVDPTGVLACCGSNPTHAVGNVLETPVRELWQSQRSAHLMRMRRGLRTCENCPEV